MRVVLTLTDEQIQRLQKNVSGNGGWQILLGQLQESIEDNDLTLQVEDISRLVRYANKYGQGGFEERLKGPLAQLYQLVETILNELETPIPQKIQDYLAPQKSIQNSKRRISRAPKKKPIDQTG